MVCPLMKKCRFFSPKSYVCRSRFTSDHEYCGRYKELTGVKHEVEDNNKR